MRFGITSLPLIDFSNPKDKFDASVITDEAKAALAPEKKS